MGHRFPIEKYSLLRQTVEREIPSITIKTTEAASVDEIRLVHDEIYISKFLSGDMDSENQRILGLPWSPALAERSVRSVGATISAARTALFGAPQEKGISATLAGGTHHAFADHGEGFCVFNDVAVAAKLIQLEWFYLHHKELKIAVIDLDVHQGNGTAKIFENDPSVFTLSIHGENNYPFTKEKSDLDISLADKCDGATYLEALENGLSKVDSMFQPDFIFYLAGADPHEGDRLGRMNLDFETLKLRDRSVFEWAHQRNIPLAICMAGGYGKQMVNTIQVHVNTLNMAVEYWQRWSKSHWRPCKETT